MSRRQEGLPYGGWTLPQFRYWARKALEARAAEATLAAGAIARGISAAMDKDAAKQLAKDLRDAAALA